MKLESTVKRIGHPKLLFVALSVLAAAAALALAKLLPALGATDLAWLADVGNNVGMGGLAGAIDAGATLFGTEEEQRRFSRTDNDDYRRRSADFERRFRDWYSEPHHEPYSRDMRIEQRILWAQHRVMTAANVFITVNVGEPVLRVSFRMKPA